MKAFKLARRLAGATAVLLVASLASAAGAQNGAPFVNLQNQINGLQNQISGVQGQLGNLQNQVNALTRPQNALMWINHLDLVGGDTDVVTNHPTYNSTTSGVGGGLSGFVIESATAGDVSVSGGNKVVEKGLEVPPGWLIRGVRVCYELTNPRSFITQIRLAQVQPIPGTAVVLLDDGTDHTDPGPVCVDSTLLPAGSEIDPSAGSVRLSLRIFVDAAGVFTAGDKIVVRALGLHLLKP